MSSVALKPCIMVSILPLSIVIFISEILPSPLSRVLQSSWAKSTSEMSPVTNTNIAVYKLSSTSRYHNFEFCTFEAIFILKKGRKKLPSSKGYSAPSPWMCIQLSSTVFNYQVLFSNKFSYRYLNTFFWVFIEVKN